MRLCCDFLLTCRAGDVIGSDFLSITQLGFPATRAVSARVMSSVSAICLLARSAMFPVVLASLFLCSPLVASLLAQLFVSWDGEPTGLLLAS